MVVRARASDIGRVHSRRSSFLVEQIVNREFVQTARVPAITLPASLMRNVAFDSGGGQHSECRFVGGRIVEGDRSIETVKFGQHHNLVSAQFINVYWLAKRKKMPATRMIAGLANLHRLAAKSCLLY
jgi:hypothetical protein